MQGPEPETLEVLRQQLQEKQDLLTLYEHRYNAEHQRGLNLEFAKLKAESRILELESLLSKATFTIPLGDNPSIEPQE